MKKIEKKIKGFENAEISEDDQNIYIDMKTGLGQSIYPKDQFDLDEAINEEVKFRYE